MRACEGQLSDTVSIIPRLTSLVLQGSPRDKKAILKASPQGTDYFTYSYDR